MKRTLVIATATLLVIGAVGLTSRHHTNRAWASMLVQLDAMEAERLARPTEREALYGETTEGLAWDHYWRALAAIEELEDLRERGFRATRPENDAQRRDRDALVAESAGALAHLSRGAHARDAASSSDFRRGTDNPIPKLVTSRALAWIACAKLRMHAGQDGELEGLRAVLDAQQYARDLTCSPVVIEELIGMSLLVPECVQHFVETRGHTLSDDAKRKWLSALDQLAAGIPTETHALLGDVEQIGRSFRVHEERTSSWAASMSIEPGWRYGFSWRVAAADYVDRGAEWADDFMSLQRRPWAEMYASLRALSLAAGEDPNPLVEIAFPKLESIAGARLENLAELSFLRHALALQLGEEPCELIDPHGNGVTVTRVDDHLRIESPIPSNPPRNMAIVFRVE
ncbi:MAG: hypothetical protein AAGI22_23975 [Planctomycetota bacterium]